jgi:ribonuclease P protein component
VKYIANPRRKYPRFAVVVSKKIYKSAVRRNRIRRRIYECIRRELPNLSNAGDLAVIVTSAEVLTMPAVKLDSLVVQLLRQACPQ